MDSNNSIDISRRSRDSAKDVKETPKEIPRPISRDQRQLARPPSQEMIRPNSRERIRSNSREGNGSARYSRERANSRDLSREGNDDIKMRCR